METLAQSPFNGGMYSLVVQLLKGASRSTRLKLMLGGLACVAVCTPLIVYEHLLWTQDEYAGFIDLVPGHLSTAGVWHAIFTTVETACVTWFLMVSFIWAKDSNRLPRTQLLGTWRVFLLYASLSILDLVSKRIHLPAGPLRLPDMIALSPIFLTTFAYLVLWLLSRSQIGEVR